MATDCSVEDCGRKRYVRGFCQRHYTAWLRYGDPLKYQRIRCSTPEQSFELRTERSESGCLEWTGTRYRNGYGQIWDGAKNALAHRYAWERENGPIPDGMQIDHACFNRACVEITHLRVASRVENGRNIQGAKSTNLSTGVRGVDIMKGKYVRGRVHVGGKEISRSFPTVDAAAEWVRAMRAEHYGEFKGVG